MLPAAPWSSEELLLLNEELLLALRSGVGLELGLRNAEPAGGGRLREFARSLSRSMDQGASLPQALAAMDPPPPAMYQVIVATGLRGNALESVLIRMGSFARLVNDLRQTLRRAMIYPWIVATTAFVLSVFMSVFMVPQLLAFVEDLRVEPTFPIRLAGWLHHYVREWSLGIILGLGLWWGLVWGLRRFTPGQGALGQMACVPGFSSLARWADLARLSHLLAILTEFGIPLPESLRYCRDAIQDRNLQQFCDQAAVEIEQGRTVSERLLLTPGVPTFLQWTLSGAAGPHDLATNLHQAAEVYRERTLQRAEWLGRILPGVLAVSLGATLVLLYAWTVISVLRALWEILL